MSKAGRGVIIKFVLQVIPSYVMSIFRLPKMLIDEIEKMMNGFWGVTVKQLLGHAMDVLG